MPCIAKKTFELASKAGARLVVQLKNNQKELLKQVKHGCKIEKPISSYKEDPTKKHGRLEERSYEVFKTRNMLLKWQKEWPYVSGSAHKGGSQKWKQTNL